MRLRLRGPSLLLLVTLGTMGCGGEEERAEGVEAGPDVPVEEEEVLGPGVTVDTQRIPVEASE